MPEKSKKTPVAQPNNELARFFELSLDLLCIAGTDGYFKRVNPAFEQALGYSQAQLLAQPIVAFVHPEDVAATKSELEKLAGGLPTTSFENRTCCSNGAYKWLAWNAYADGQAIYAVVRDITDQKTLDGALGIGEGNVRLLLETAPIGILVLNSEGQMVILNRKIEEMFGYREGELLGKPVERLLPERFRQRHAWHRADFFAEPRIRPMGRDLELVGRRRDGTEFPVDVALSYASGRHGPLAIGFVVDVTGRSEAEAERERLIGELEAFAHTVAHDLRSPLSLVLGYASLLKGESGSISESERREYLKAIEETADRMDTIIDELLLLSSVRGQEHVETGRLDMAQIVEEALERVKHLAKESHARVTLPPSWPTAVGYGPWVVEMWVNYLSNAIQYGGKPPRLELGATEPDGGQVRFWVRDNGQGLTTEEQSRLFAPFTRLKQARVSGHGLGLSIVRRIAERLGGSVGVESQLGVGSTFIFTLPSLQDKETLLPNG